MKAPIDFTAAIVWAQYGPYHFARFRAAQASAKSWHFLAVEIASRTTTYAWDRKDREASLHTLCPGEAAEGVGFLKVFLRAFRFFRRHHVKVAFVPSYWPSSSLAVLVAAKFSGARLVMMNESHRHTAQATGFKLHIKRWLVRLFDAALVGGRPQREYFTEMGLAAESIFDGYDVVDNEYFREKAEKLKTEIMKAEIRNQYALPETYFLNIGRMVEKKNLSILVRAYRAFLDQAANPPKAAPHLVFVGSGEDESKLRTLCHELKLPVYDKAKSEIGNEPPGVHFYGFRQAEELPMFYSFARVFILPSKREEWGLVVNEAMVCGLPVLVSRVAGCAPDLVSEGVNGFTINPADVNALAERLQWFANNAAVAGEMGVRSLERIQAWDLSRFGVNAECAANFALVGKNVATR